MKVIKKIMDTFDHKKYSKHWNTWQLPPLLFFTMNLFLKSIAFPLLKPPFLPSPLHKMHILTLAIVVRRTADPGEDDVRGVLAEAVSGVLEVFVLATAGVALPLFSVSAAFSLFSRGFLAGVGLEAFLAAESPSLELSSPWETIFQN